MSAQLIAYTPRSSSAAFPSVRSKVFTRSPARKRSYLDEYCVNSNRAERIGPISPSADLIRAIAGSCAGRIASANTAPLRSAAAVAASSDISSAAAGFSQQRRLSRDPRKYSDCGMWSAFGDAISTASNAPSSYAAHASSNEVNTRSAPERAAKASPVSFLRESTAEMPTPSSRRTASVKIVGYEIRSDYEKIKITSFHTSGTTERDPRIGEVRVVLPCAVGENRAIENGHRNVHARLIRESGASRRSDLVAAFHLVADVHRGVEDEQMTVLPCSLLSCPRSRDRSRRFVPCSRIRPRIPTLPALHAEIAVPSTHL